MKKNLIYNTIYQLLTMVIPLLTTPYLSRILGGENIGIYSYNYSIAYYFSIFILLGLNTYGNREIAKISKDNKHHISKTFWSIYTMQLILGIIIFTSYMIYSIYVAKDKTISLIFSIYILSVILDINWFYFGLEKFEFTVTRNIIIKVLFTSSIFFLVRTNNDVYMYSFIMVTSFAASQIPLWIFLHKEINYVKPKFSTISKHIKPNMFLFLSILGVSLYKYMDKIMLGLMSTMSQVGIYEQAEKIIGLPTALIVSLGTVMLPRMTNMYKNDKCSTIKYLKKSIYFSVLTSSVLCLGIISVRDIFVPIFYGEGFELISSIYLILLPSCIFMGIGNVITTQYLIPKGMDSVYIKSIFFGAFINVLINLLLVGKYAALGVSFGTLIAEMSVCMYKIYACKKEFPIYKYLFNTWPALFSSIGMCIILRLLSICAKINIYSLIINIFIGGVIFLVLFIVFNFINYKIKKL